MTKLIENVVIKLDLDGEDAFNEFLSRGWLCKYLGLIIPAVRVYKTDNGYHIYLHTKNSMTAERLILIESLLGDDYRRVLCNLLSVIQGCNDPKDYDILFMRKYRLDRLGRITVASEEKYDSNLSNQLYEVLNYELSEKITILAKGGDARDV